MVTKKSNLKKKLAYYMNLPWTYIIEQGHDEEGTFYVVRIAELPGITTDAPTIPEAMENIKEAMLLDFKVSLNAGDEIPEPLTAKNFKGNIAYRTSAERHYFLAREAKKRNLSLSQVIDTLIDAAHIAKVRS